MNRIAILISNIPIEILSSSEATVEFFKPYATEQTSVFCVLPTEEDILIEIRKIQKRDSRRKIKKEYSDAYYEISAILRLIAEKLISFNILLFHGAAVVYKDETYLFSAPSRTGKTTHAKKWPRLISGAYILNGDKPFIRVEDNDTIWVCGNPWQGKEDYGTNEIKHLKAICYIERSEQNSIRKLEKEEAFPLLSRQFYWTESNKIKALQLFNKIINNTDLFLLRCNKDDESAIISFNAMVNQK